MPTFIPAPTVVAAAGNKPKRIEEYAGHVNSGHSAVSVARMASPGGWVEPGQRPEFEEITVVLRGRLRVEYEGGALDVVAGQAVVTAPGEWSATPRPTPTARNTWPCACRHFRPRPCTAICSRHGDAGRHGERETFAAETQRAGRRIAAEARAPGEGAPRSRGERGE